MEILSPDVPLALAGFWAVFGVPMLPTFAALMPVSVPFLFVLGVAY